MVDITAKQISKRSAKAVAFISCSEGTVDLIKTGKIPKGNPLEMAKAAAFFGAKNTANLLPHCHPVTIDGMEITYEFISPSSTVEGVGRFDSYGVLITGEALSIGKTGIEMEILTGVSVAALTIYDMLKPVDKNLAIGKISLLDKKGGKSDKEKYYQRAHTCGIIICSDAIKEGKKVDKVSSIIHPKLEKYNCQIVDTKLVSQDKTQLTQAIDELISKDVHFIFTCGATGQSDDDIAAMTVNELVDKNLDGVVDAMRHFSLDRTALGMVSRLAAGVKAKTTIVTLPGSQNGCTESLDGILPYIFHIRKML